MSGTENGAESSAVRNAGVTLSDRDYLRFSIPKVHEEIWRLESGELNRALDRLLLEDPVQAFDVMVTRMRAWEAEMLAAGRNVQLPEAQIEAVRALVPIITEDDILLELIRRLPSQRPYMHEVRFRRSMRMPENGRLYEVPSYIPSHFVPELVDDHAARVPARWAGRNGVIVPMTQGEVLWVIVYSYYPCAMKLTVGRVNAMTGEISQPGLQSHPQNYFVLPDLYELHCYRAGRNFVRQFTAPRSALGQYKEGNSGELHFEVFPLRPALYMEQEIKPRLPASLTLADIMHRLLNLQEPDNRREYKYPRPPYLDPYEFTDYTRPVEFNLCVGIIPEKRTTLGIRAAKDTRPLSDYETGADADATGSFHVHLCNPATWKTCTGAAPPPSPLTEAFYKVRWQVPWYEEYRDSRWDGQRWIG